MKLHPFSSLPGLHISVSANLHRAKEDPSALDLQFEILGDLNALEIPQRSDSHPPSRRDSLWENTCLEAFIKPAHGSQYWEVNLSPSGDWNVFSFSDYRTAMKEEEGVLNLAIHSQQNVGRFLCSARIALEPSRAMEWSGSLEVGLTSVVRLKDGSQTFWAIKHVGEKPDFHLFESFGLTI